MLRTDEEHHYQIETLQRGETRSISDQAYGWLITDLETPPRDEVTVRAYCQEHIRKSYPKAEKPSWADPELVEFVDTKSGVWKYVVREAYTG